MHWLGEGFWLLTLAALAGLTRRLPYMGLSEIRGTNLHNSRGLVRG